MHNTAAYWTDCLFPNIPVRQWVLSLPWELRLLAAARPAVVTALGRIFMTVVFEHYRKVAGRPDSRCGAALSLHRAGDSLDLNLHFHGLAVDGVFIRDDEQAAVASKLRRHRRLRSSRRLSLGYVTELCAGCHATVI